jgi:hypothetical protein
MFKLLGLGFATLLLSVSGLAAPQAVAPDLIARAAQVTVVSVVVKNAALGPAPLPGLKYAHITSTVGPVIDDNAHYPVLVIAGYSYWGEGLNSLNSVTASTYCYILLIIAFSWTDNRVGLAILAYDPSNNLVGRWDMTEARYLFSIVYDSASSSVVFTGQVGHTITIPIIQLLEPIVFMSIENAATQPAAPSGLDYVTFDGDNTQYPVLIVGTYTYWREFTFGSSCCFLLNADEKFSPELC